MPSRARIIPCCFLVASAVALTLQSTLLTVELDSLAPRALSYQFLPTNASFMAALTGYGFHPSVNVNSGAATCGEASFSTQYVLIDASSAIFTCNMTCLFNFATVPGAVRVSASPLVTITLEGSVAAVDDPAVSGTAFFSWILTSVTSSEPSALPVRELDFIGFESVTLQSAPPSQPGCMYVPDDWPNIPSCAGDTYFVDAWSRTGIDLWQTPIWQGNTLFGNVNANDVSGGQVACEDGVRSRAGLGPYLSVIAGGWNSKGDTGVVATSSARQTPFWTGPRSYDAPGRCSVFTIASSTIHTEFQCGSTLPFKLNTGFFPDVTRDGSISGDDLYLYRRSQYPDADALYFTSMVYKLGLDYTAYAGQHDWSVIDFPTALQWIANNSLISDGYPQHPILVGWQGLGHDTLYPGLDEVNVRLGGQAGLAALAQAAQAYNTTLAYHINVDEAYSKFNGSANAEWNQAICRVNVDHSSRWWQNYTAGGEQIPDAGLRCSVSKTVDAISGGRYTRINRMLGVAPVAGTLHVDAWRNNNVDYAAVGADGWGYIGETSEDFCGCAADAANFRAINVSIGCEANDGVAKENMGEISYYYHAPTWTSFDWGKVISGSSGGMDLDMYGPVGTDGNGLYGFETIADRFYLQNKLYQLALTDVMLASGDTMTFAQGGVIHRNHTALAVDAKLAWRHPDAAGVTVWPPSTWLYGGDIIPVSDGLGGMFLPWVQSKGVLDPWRAHIYQKSTSINGCPLIGPAFTAANNTVITGLPMASWNMNGSVSEDVNVAVCNATCWGNATCAGWDLIKVTNTSGKTVPLCTLYSIILSCGSDPNQWAGAKAPVVPANVTQRWTLPLSWTTAQPPRTIVADLITPSGVQPATPPLTISGRNLTLQVPPGRPIRLRAV